jgi:hypothetical protein
MRGENRGTFGITPVEEARQLMECEFFWGGECYSGGFTGDETSAKRFVNMNELGGSIMGLPYQGMYSAGKSLWKAIASTALEIRSCNIKWWSLIPVIFLPFYFES